MSTSTLSVQLYTVREQLADDLPGTLERLAEVGFRQVEPYAFTAFGPALGAALRAADLTAPTAHASFLGQDSDPIFAAASDLGIGTVIDPVVPAERWRTAEDVADIAHELNSAAEIAARHGVKVGYHNHAHELENLIGGTTALELLASQLSEEVILELDTYWAVVGGQDPIELLGRLGSRVQAIHVKDGPGTAETKDQVAVGRGSLPIREIIAAAPHALRVIELDESRGDLFIAVSDSYRFLTETDRA
ncbi:sugar phosphate isomerase/epimerase [Leifsonia bigeumensis]|uniref:Sugar phosphate isomerase/epimerase n=1 Tax=Leifsonella bigeumensis TaxID=433643 RepID=A0ABP7F5V0_9MICO